MADNLPTSIKNLNTLLGEQLAEGGGGGSSDFSTAQVTVTNNAYAPLIAPLVVDEEGYVGIFIQNNNPGQFEFALYKGMCQALVSNYFDYSVAVTGNAVYEEGTITVTGDCAITINNAG